MDLTKGIWGKLVGVSILLKAIGSIWLIANFYDFIMSSFIISICLILIGLVSIILLFHHKEKFNVG